MHKKKKEEKEEEKEIFTRINVIEHCILDRHFNLAHWLNQTNRSSEQRRGKRSHCCWLNLRRCTMIVV